MELAQDRDEVLDPTGKHPTPSRSERALAQSVFGQTFPYDRVFITDLDLGDAVTLMNFFQRRNHLVVDRDFGGPHSAPPKEPAQPVGTSVRWQ